MKMPDSVIREEISKRGVISFARFMEIALYCPEFGYYEAKKDTVGRHGDFITSVSVGSLFGELLAYQFSSWLRELPGQGGRFTLLEAGAHDGKLAKDILTWLQENRPQLLDQLEYVILEPSGLRVRWQMETLVNFAPRVRWITRINELITGIIFSNELLDAFPVRRFGWDAAARAWFEWGVALDGEDLCWARMPAVAMPASDLCPRELESVLPHGYVVEASPAARQWWTEAAGKLQHGKLLAIDYGYAGHEVFSPARSRGTLRAYHRHQVSDNLLANPGEQDLTAHVNFTAIQKAGESVGLGTEQLTSQPQFLTRILQRAVTENTFARLDSKQVRQFQTLTHPEHLGRAFRVLVQTR